MYQIAGWLVSIVVGAVIVINGTVLSGKDILDETKKAVDGANLHQLATVVEVYYADHGHYPKARGGQELINVLSREKYILNRSLNAKEFAYEDINDGSDYALEVKTD